MNALTPFEIRKQLILDSASPLLTYSGKCSVCGTDCNMLNGTTWCTNSKCFETVYSNLLIKKS